MTESLEERRTAAYDELERIVQTLSDLDDERDRADGEVVDRNTPTAWALVVGFDSMTEDFQFGAGMTAVYPRGGMQASWKTIGILATALGKYQAPT